MQQARHRLHVVKQLLIWQLLVAFGAGAAGLGWGSTGGLSALLGGLICWLPNCYFAFRAFRHRGARAARLIVRSFYAGAAGKLVLSMALFTIVFINVRPLNAPALFAGFIGVQFVSWLVPVFAGRAESRA